MALKKDFSATGAAFSFARSAFSGATGSNQPTRNTPTPAANTAMLMTWGLGGK